jgi:hypothetical protein
MVHTAGINPAARQPRGFHKKILSGACIGRPIVIEYFQEKTQIRKMTACFGSEEGWREGEAGLNPSSNRGYLRPNSWESRLSR